MSAGAQELQTVEINMDALRQFQVASLPTQAPSYAPRQPLPPVAQPAYAQQQQAYEVAARQPAPYPTYHQPPPSVPIPPVQVRVSDSAEGGSSSSAFEGELSGNVGFVTDYTFRGVSQTSEAPAVQGGFDYAHPSGGYVGIWASSIDFGDAQAGTEIDYYAGYSKEIGGGVTADGGVIYYQYPGARDDLNYDFYEVYGGISYDAQIGGQEVATDASISYSPDYFGGSGEGYYLKAGASTPVGNGFTLDGHLGYQFIEDEDTFGLPDYADWSIGLAYELEGFELKAQYIDTSISSTDCPDGCDAKGVLSVSRSL